MNIRLVLALMLCGLGVAPVLAAQPVPYLPVPHDAAVILDTGSTNTPGYRIVAQRDGAVEYVIGGTRNRTHASGAQATALFDALKAGMPLSQLPTARCMKSASFGTAMFVYWNHQRSPDLTCPSGSETNAVYSSVTKFVDALGIARRGMVPLPANEPRRAMPEPSPSPSM